MSRDKIVHVVFLGTLFLCVLGLVSHSNASDTDLPWTVEYHVYDLPEASNPPWTTWTKTVAYNTWGSNSVTYWATVSTTSSILQTNVVASGGSCIPCHPGGGSLYSTSSNSWPLSYKINDSSFWNSIGTTAEAKVWYQWQTVNTASLGLAISDGDYSQILRISSSGIKVSSWGSISPSTTMPTTDGYHIYRMTLQGANANVYVDGNQTPVLSGNAVPSWSTFGTTEKYVKFGFYTGHGTSTPGPNADWRYVKYYSGGAYSGGDGVDDSVDNCPDVYNPPVASWIDVNGVTHYNSQPDYDLDGIGDACDPDGDGDGYFSPGTRGLLASYSNGEILLEGPVFNGWWGVTHNQYPACIYTGTNLYLGDCTPLSLSPLDWAYNSAFSVSWTGYLYAPVSGNYTFSSNYWVDGGVFIEINNTVVANINTTGGGYSNTLVLTGGTWYPVYMAFTPNGGSNNMHLGWTPPGGAWEPVPRKYLAPADPSNPAAWDCDDDNPLINPLTIWYADLNNDGYPDGGTTQQCPRPANYKLAYELLSPVVTSIFPAAGATGVPVDAVISATFSSAMDGNTINPASFIVVKQSDSSTAGGTASYVSASRTAQYSGHPNFAYSTTYVARLKGGTGAVKDIAGNPMASDYSWTFRTICPSITVSPSSLPGGTTGITYSKSLYAGGGTSPYTYSITAGSLPAGLLLNTSTGLVSGISTGAATYNFTVTATDKNGCTGSRAYTLAFSYPNIMVSPSSWNYGSVTVGKGALKTFVISNTGAGNLVISKIELTGTDASQFTKSLTSSLNIAPGKSYAITVGFYPKSTGTKSATLKITSNDPDTPALTVPLTGTGTR